MRDFGILSLLDDLNGLPSVTTAPFAIDPISLSQQWTPKQVYAVTNNDLLMRKQR